MRAKYIILILLTAVAVRAGNGAAAVAENQIWLKEYHDAMNSRIPELRIVRLITLLEKYPEQAERVGNALLDEWRSKKFSPDIRKRMDALFMRHQEDFLLTSLLPMPLRQSGENQEIVRRQLLNYDFSRLSIRARGMIPGRFAYLLNRYRKLEKFADGDKFIREFSGRECVKNLPPEIKVYLVFSALNFYWHAVWQEECTAPNFERWKTLPVKGSKAGYVFWLEELNKISPELEWPHSFQALFFYRRHHLADGVRLAEHLAGSRIPAVRQNVLALAVNVRNFKLFSSVANEENSPEDAYIAAAVFQQFDFLSGKIPDAEFQLIKAMSLKDHARAGRFAGLLLNSGAVKFHGSIHALIEYIWALKEKDLRQARHFFRKLAAVCRKNPDKFLTPAYANSLGYTAAVLNIELELARNLLTAALKDNKNNSAFLDSMAYILYRRRNYPAARQMIRKAIQNCTPDVSCAPLFLHGAEIEFALGNRAKAAEYLKRAEIAAQSDDSEFDYQRAAKLKDDLK